MRTGRERERNRVGSRGVEARGLGKLTVTRFCFKPCLVLKVFTLNFFENCQKMQISQIEI